MKRKLFLVLSLAVMAMLLFAFSVSAEGLIPLDVDPGLDCDDSLVSYFASIAEPKTISTTERAVITDGTKSRSIERSSEIFYWPAGSPHE